jgi:hypothetical protein
MRPFLPMLLLVCLLAACGADGPPETPSPRPASGVTVSGEASVGVVVNN